MPKNETINIDSEESLGIKVYDSDDDPKKKKGKRKKKDKLNGDGEGKNGHGHNCGEEYKKSNKKMEDYAQLASDLLGVDFEDIDVDQEIKSRGSRK